MGSDSIFQAYSFCRFIGEERKKKCKYLILREIVVEYEIIMDESNVNVKWI